MTEIDELKTCRVCGVMTHPFFICEDCAAEQGDDNGCYRCGGEGFIITCIDDMCRGAGECMHGDGESVCPACNGMI